MLSEKASFLAFNIHVVFSFKQLVRCWLICIVNDYAKLCSFTQPIEHVDFLI
nr:MAG TPA: hypothetical protein [Caudoviricetes sp.]